MDIKQSVAFVTGSNRGIGKVIVKTLLDAGIQKIYTAARRPQTQPNNSYSGSYTDPRIVPLSLDLTKPDEISAAARRAGDTNLLINNAGIANFEGFLSAKDTQAARAEMEVNYFGSMQMIRSFAPILAANGGGMIVQMSSIAGHIAFPAVGSYSASKAAVNMMIQGVRAELAAQGTKVVGIYPGVVDTEMSVEFNVPGVPPIQIASAILKAVEEETEDVFPDAMSEEIRTNLLDNPKLVERQFMSMLPA